MGVVLSAALGFVNGLLACMGVWVSLRPPKAEHHRRCILAFAIIGAAAVFLTGWIALKGTHDRDNLRVKIDSVNNQLTESRVELARMSGHLEGVQTIMVNLSKSSWPGMKEYAAAIINLAETQSATKQLTDERLCDKALDVAKRLRSLHAKQSADDNTALSKTIEAMRIAKTPEEQTQIWQRTSPQTHAAHEAELGQMLGDILYVKDGLQQKLTSEPEPDFNARIVFSGHLAGTDPLIHAANYLDAMARRLCTK
jgi:hypothetical protein